MTIPEASMTLILQIGVSGDPRGVCYKAPSGPYLRIYSVTIVLKPNLVCFGLIEKYFDIHLIIPEASMTLMLQIGVSEDPRGVCFKVPSGPFFRICSVTIVLQPNLVCFGFIKDYYEIHV